MESCLLSKEQYKNLLFNHLNRVERDQFLQRIRNSTTSPRVFYHDIQQQTAIGLTEVQRLAETCDPVNAVLVVENIDLKWLVDLGVAFKIDPTFFAEHTYNPCGLTPYKAVFGKWSAHHMKPVQTRTLFGSRSRQSEPENGKRTSWHIDGVLEYSNDWDKHGKHLMLRDPNFLHRISAYDEEYGWSTNTRISYSLVKEGLCMSRVQFRHFQSSLC
jgi:hypothetical protein